LLPHQQRPSGILLMHNGRLLRWNETTCRHAATLKAWTLRSARPFVTGLRAVTVTDEVDKAFRFAILGL